MSVHKVVIRLDFARACFTLLDKVGSICDKIADIPDPKGDSEQRFFQQIQESANIRVYSGQRKTGDESEYVLLQLGPSFLACHWEIAEGIRFEDFGRDERVQRLLRFAYELLTDLKITKFARAGVRFHCLEGFAPDRNVDAISKKIDEQLLTTISAAVGKPNDFAFSMNGKGEDDLLYRLSFGPYFPANESLQFFGNVAAAMKSREGDSLYFDLDIYEEQVTLHVNPSKWAQPAVDKAKRLVKGIVESLGTEQRYGNVT